MTQNNIKIFNDGTRIYFDIGKFDSWCVYIQESDGEIRPPKDIEYFDNILSLKSEKDSGSIYEDFISIYEKTQRNLDKNLLNQINVLSKGYGDLSLYAEKLFVILYATMIAEMNKTNTKLGKRIKRLGIHKILIENMDCHQAANFMKGMGWREISKLCDQRGF